MSTGVEKNREAIVCSCEEKRGVELHDDDPERGLAAYIIPRRQLSISLVNGWSDEVGSKHCLQVTSVE
jgi:hypothetical protein